MEQVTVPQFLDVEDQIIGPISVRQFIEMLIGAMIIFIFYKLFDFSLFIVTGVPTFMITVVFAFAKINGQSFHLFLLNFIATLKSPKLKIWKKVISEHDVKAAAKMVGEQATVKVLTPRRPISAASLSELSLIVDTGGVYRGEGIINLNNRVK